MTYASKNKKKETYKIDEILKGIVENNSSDDDIDRKIQIINSFSQ